MKTALGQLSWLWYEERADGRCGRIYTFFRFHLSCRNQRANRSPLATPAMAI